MHIQQFICTSGPIWQLSPWRQKFTYRHHLKHHHHHLSSVSVQT